MGETLPVDLKTQRAIAVDLFNHVWELMEKTDRSAYETDEMIDAAHASRYFWSLVGTEVNYARGEWQISRVYALLGRAEPALYHARRTLQLCLDNKIGDFDLAFAYEAMARSAKVSGNESDCAHYLALAHEASEHIQDEEDRQLVLNDLNTIDTM